MANRGSFEFVDKVLDGRLAFELRRMRAEDLTYDQMVNAFAGKGIDVSRETLRRWSNKVGAGASAGDAA